MFVFIVEKHIEEGSNGQIRTHLSVHESPLAARDEALRIAGNFVKAHWPNGADVLAAFGNEGGTITTIRAIELQRDNRPDNPQPQRT